MKTATSPVAQSHSSTYVWGGRGGAARGHDDGGDRCPLRGGAGRAGERHSGHVDLPEPVVPVELGKRLRVGAWHAQRGIEGLPLHG
eukprot:scaffold89228_cov68-Phaeocystis_antarctica.AAC.8